MLKIKRALVFFLVITLALIVFGCRENPSATGEQQLLEEGSPDEVETATAQDFDVFVPDGKTDRLPGSLKWDSVTVYTAGIDFIRDQSDGLLTNAVSTKTSVTSTPTTQTVETTATTEGSDQNGQSGSGNYTSTYSGGGGSVTTDVTVDGSMKITESTTINNGGSGSSTTWWE